MTIIRRGSPACPQRSTHMRRLRDFPLLCGYLVAACLAATIASAKTSTHAFPAVMVIDGIIAGQGATAPRAKDPIRVLNERGELEGTGSIVDDRGGFFVQLSKAKEFIGTQLTLRLRRSDTEYALLQDHRPFKFRFAADFPVKRLSGLSLHTGAVTAIHRAPITARSGTQPNPQDSMSRDGGEQYDVNGDHKFTKKDVEFVKGVLAGKIKDNGRADTNQDHTVNARDLIEIIRAFKQQARSGG